MAKERHKKEKLRQRVRQKQKQMPEFIDTFKLKSVYCNACKLIAVQKDTAFTICANANELRFEALKEHQKMIEESKVICIAPEFIISYESVLVSNSLLNPKAEKSSLIM